MRHDGLWHPRLLAILAAAGHGDLVVLADAGLPVPDGVETVDLLWRRGEPGLLPVLETVLAECPAEHATLAVELADRELRASLAAVLNGMPVDEIPHEQLKQTTRHASVVVRTGAVTPYANVVLRCGVAF